MANIAITNYCNLKCPYCFADDMIQEKSTAITLEDFRNILMFLSRTPNNHVGIIGGEPTLHPKFEEIIKEVNKYCRESNAHATLFTNGIELEKWLPILGDRIGVLINCNSPNNMSEDNYNKMIKTLDKAYELSLFDSKINVGCNVHPGCTDYSWIWEVVDKYKLKHIRCSVVSPGGCYRQLRVDKELYYNKMKPIFLDFCKKAKEHNCSLSMDCGRIPTCYFEKDELDLVYSITDGYNNSFCNPVIDITSDYRATACFGSYDPIDMRDFNDIFELERYLLIKKTLPRVNANCTGKCSTCKKHELLQCQGGCLGFAEV